MEMTANLYGIEGPTSCLGKDPLGTVGDTGGFIPISKNIATNNAETREKASRWNENRDAALKKALRGRQ